MNDLRRTSCHKRKHDSIPSSPSGVIDAYFSSDSSVDSWAVTSSVSSSPETVLKRSRAQDQHMRLAPLSSLSLGMTNRTHWTPHCVLVIWDINIMVPHNRSLQLYVNFYDNFVQLCDWLWPYLTVFSGKSHVMMDQKNIFSNWLCHLFDWENGFVRLETRFIGFSFFSFFFSFFV